MELTPLCARHRLAKTAAATEDLLVALEQRGFALNDCAALGTWNGDARPLARGIESRLACRRAHRRLTAAVRLSPLHHRSGAHRADRIYASALAGHLVADAGAKSGRPIVSALVPTPALPYRIVGVVLSGAEKQMRGVHAGRVVAMVADKHPVRDGATEQLVARAVRGHHVVAVQREAPVGTARVRSVTRRAVAASGPLPTAGVRDDAILAAETVQRSAKVSRHEQNLIHKRALRHVSFYGTSA